MVLAKVFSCAVVGLDGVLVEVEVDVGNGQPGIFVVGDVRHGSVKRVASGVGEGSVAISFVHQYLSKVV